MPITMSRELLVDMVADGRLLLPLVDPGSELLESKGLLKLAPLIPNTISPLYSPPKEPAHPEIDSVIMSEESLFVLLAQNSPSWSRFPVPGVPSFLPDALPLSVQERPAVSVTLKVQEIWRSSISLVKTMIMSFGCDVLKLKEHEFVL